MPGRKTRPAAPFRGIPRAGSASRGGSRRLDPPYDYDITPYFGRTVTSISFAS